MSFTISKFGAELTVPDLTINNADIKVFPVSNLKYKSGIEQEIVFKKTPQRFTFPIPVTTKNLEFKHQPSLKLEVPEEKCSVWTDTYVKLLDGSERFRPTENVGSLAVYHNVKRGNNAKTGKICHIPRPICVDKDEAVGYGVVRYENEQLIVDLPEEYMKNARYPVTVDPTFGDTSAGGSWTGVGDEGFISGRFELTEAGTITKLTSYLRQSDSTARNMKSGYYSDKAGPKPDALQQENGEVSVEDAAWYDFDVADTAEAAAFFWLANQFQTSQGQIAYDAVGTCEYNTGDSYAGAMPDPAPATSNANLIISIYATYTVAGGVSIPVAMNQYGMNINKKVRGG